MLRTIAACVVALSSVSAAGKCVDLPYTLSGQVVGPDGRPVAGASILVTWRDHTERHQSRARSREDGSFLLEFRVHAYSGPGLLVTDTCDFSLKRATVEIEAEQLSRKVTEVKFSGNASKTVVALEAKRG